jgi:hypothetical protein
MITTAYCFRGLFTPVLVILSIASVESFSTSNPPPTSVFLGTRRTQNGITALKTTGDDEFHIPESRWESPCHEDVCSETGVTLSRYMMEMVRANPELEEIESSTLSETLKRTLVPVITSSLELVHDVSPFFILYSLYVPASCLQNIEQLGSDVRSIWPYWIGRWGRFHKCARRRTEKIGRDRQ